MKNFVMVILMTAVISQTAKADCEATLRPCDDALQAADRAINAQALLIDNMTAETQTVQRALDTAMAERAEALRWYKQPEFVGPLAFIVGIVVGVKAGSK